MVMFSSYFEVLGHGRQSKRSLWGRIRHSPFLAGCLIGAMVVGGVPLVSATEPPDAAVETTSPDHQNPMTEADFTQ